MTLYQGQPCQEASVFRLWHSSKHSFSLKEFDTSSGGIVFWWLTLSPELACTWYVSRSMHDKLIVTKLTFGAWKCVVFSVLALSWIGNLSKMNPASSATSAGSAWRIHPALKTRKQVRKLHKWMNDPGIQLDLATKWKDADTCNTSKAWGW